MSFSLTPPPLDPEPEDFDPDPGGGDSFSGGPRILDLDASSSSPASSVPPEPLQAPNDPPSSCPRPEEPEPVDTPAEPVDGENPSEDVDPVLAPGISETPAKPEDEKTNSSDDLEEAADPVLAPSVSETPAETDEKSPDAARNPSDAAESETAQDASSPLEEASLQLPEVSAEEETSRDGSREQPAASPDPPTDSQASPAEDDDFGDFEEFEQFVSQTPQSSHPGAESGEVEDGWAAFEAPSGEEPEDVGDKGDWAADFGPPASLLSAPVEPVTLPDGSQLPRLSQALADEAAVLAELFPAAGETEASKPPGSLFGLIGEKDQLWGEAVEGSCDTSWSGEEVWQRLREVEESVALRLVWGSLCSGYLALLGALGVSHELAKARLGDQRRPAFARQLDVVKMAPTPILAPTPAPIPVALATTSGKGWSPAGTGEERWLRPGLVEGGGVVVRRVQEPPPKDKELPSSLSVPPVEFSWTDSGLTNPLGQASHLFLACLCFASHLRILFFSEPLLESMTK